MTYTLLLGDEGEPAVHFDVVCRSYDEAVAYVSCHGTPLHIQFDHDLGPDSETGADFALWLVNRALDGHGFPETFDVHSQNPVGAEFIRFIMNGHLRWMDRNDD